MPMISLSCLPFVAVTAISFMNLLNPLNPLILPTLVTFSLIVSAASKSHTSTNRTSLSGVSTGLRYGYNTRVKHTVLKMFLFLNQSKSELFVQR